MLTARCAVACVSFACWLLLALSGRAWADGRYALLVGNQGYAAKVGPLKNPHNDVALVGMALTKLGFKVTVLKDAGYKSIDTALKTHVQMVRRAGKGTISFMYYSGHGASDPETGINYLIPVDVESADDADLWTNSFELNDIVSKFRDQAPEATHYVIFDACREELRLTRQGKKTLGAEKGFNPVMTVAGVMIAYATAPNNTASDIGDKGGPYATALSEEIGRPGFEAITMFRNVQLKVKQAIGQDPWLSFPTLPPVYFSSKNDDDGAEHKKLIEKSFWESARSNGSTSLLSTYIERYPMGVYAPLARKMIEDLERRSAEESAQIVRAEKQREAARLSSELVEKEAQAAKDIENAKRRQVPAAQPALTPAPLPNAGQLKALEEEAKAAHEQARKSEEQRQAALTSFQDAQSRLKAAATDATKPTVSHAVASLAVGIQRELKRLGCQASEAEPAWTPKASASLARYLKSTKQTLPKEGLTVTFLDHLKETKDRVCTTACDDGEKAVGGKCAVIAPQAPPVAPRVAQARSGGGRSGGSGGGGGGGCEGKGWICRSLQSGKNK